MRSVAWEKGRLREDSSEEFGAFICCIEKHVLEVSSLQQGSYTDTQRDVFGLNICRLPTPDLGHGLQLPEWLSGGICSPKKQLF